MNTAKSAIIKWFKQIAYFGNDDADDFVPNNV